MRTVLLVCCITLISAYCSSPARPGNLVRYQDAGFPFELDENRMDYPSAWTAYVIMEPRYYNKQNLDRIFLWYSQKHPDRNEMLAVAVYTDPEQLRLYRENADDDMSNYGDRPHKVKYRSPPWDAYCYRRGEGFSDCGGDNLLYSYLPDLSRPDQTKRIVLRGMDYNADQKIIESWESSNANFKVSVIACELYPNVEPVGTYYTFSSATRLNGFGNPRIVLTIRQGKVRPIPREQVKLISDQIGYVWMGWIYAVTTDGGATWQKWDAELELPDWQCCDPNLIQDVNIAFDGTGMMTLRPDPAQPEKVLVLHTKDYGQHWKAE